MPDILKGLSAPNKTQLARQQDLPVDLRSVPIVTTKPESEVGDKVTPAIASKEATAAGLSPAPAAGEPVNVVPVKLDNGDYVSAESYNKLEPKQQAELKKRGIAGYQTWLREQLDAQTRLYEQDLAKYRAEQAAFLQSSILLKSGEYVDREAYNRLSPNLQTELVNLGVAAFNTKYANGTISSPAVVSAPVVNTVHIGNADYLYSQLISAGMTPDEINRAQVGVTGTADPTAERNRLLARYQYLTDNRERLTDAQKQERKDLWAQISNTEYWAQRKAEFENYAIPAWKVIDLVRQGKIIAQAPELRTYIPSPYEQWAQRVKASMVPAAPKPPLALNKKAYNAADLAELGAYNQQMKSYLAAQRSYQKVLLASVASTPRSGGPWVQSGARGPGTGAGYSQAAINSLTSDTSFQLKPVAPPMLYNNGVPYSPQSLAAVGKTLYAGANGTYLANADTQPPAGYEVVFKATPGSKIEYNPAPVVQKAIGIEANRANNLKSIYEATLPTLSREEIKRLSTQNADITRAPAPVLEELGAIKALQITAYQSATQAGLPDTKAYQFSVDYKNAAASGELITDLAILVQEHDLATNYKIAKTGEYIPNKVLENLAKDEQSILLDQGSEAYKVLLVNLPDGSYMRRVDFNALPGPEQRMLTEHGYDYYLAYARAQEAKFQTENLQLKTGEWVNRDEFSRLPVKAQAEAQEKGLNAIDLSKMKPIWQFYKMKDWGLIPSKDENGQPVNVSYAGVDKDGNISYQVEDNTPLYKVLWRNMTPWDEAAGEKASAGGVMLMGADMVIPFFATARNWDKMESPVEKAFWLGLDVATLIPFAGWGIKAGQEAARVASPAFKAASKAARASEIAWGEAKTAMRTIQTLKFTNPRYAEIAALAQTAIGESLRADRTFAETLNGLKSLTKAEARTLEIRSGFKGLGKTITGVNKAQAGLLKRIAATEKAQEAYKATLATLGKTQARLTAKETALVTRAEAKMATKPAKAEAFAVKLDKQKTALAAQNTAVLEKTQAKLGASLKAIYTEQSALDKARAALNESISQFGKKVLPRADYIPAKANPAQAARLAGGVNKAYTHYTNLLAAADRLKNSFKAATHAGKDAEAKLAFQKLGTVQSKLQKANSELLKAVKKERLLTTSGNRKGISVAYREALDKVEHDIELLTEELSHAHTNYDAIKSSSLASSSQLPLAKQYVTEVENMLESSKSILEELRHSAHSTLHPYEEPRLPHKAVDLLTRPGAGPESSLRTYTKIVKTGKNKWVEERSTVNIATNKKIGKTTRVPIEVREAGAGGRYVSPQETIERLTEGKGSGLTKEQAKKRLQGQYKEPEINVVKQEPKPTKLPETGTGELKTKVAPGWETEIRRPGPGKEVPGGTGEAPIENREYLEGVIKELKGRRLSKEDTAELELYEKKLAALERTAETPAAKPSAGGLKTREVNRPATWSSKFVGEQQVTVIAELDDPRKGLLYRIVDAYGEQVTVPAREIGPAKAAGEAGATASRTATLAENALLPTDEAIADAQAIITRAEKRMPIGISQKMAETAEKLGIKVSGKTPGEVIDDLRRAIKKHAPPTGQKLTPAEKKILNVTEKPLPTTFGRMSESKLRGLDMPFEEEVQVREQLRGLDDDLVMLHLNDARLNGLVNSTKQEALSYLQQLHTYALKHKSKYLNFVDDAINYVNKNNMKEAGLSANAALTGIHSEMVRGLPGWAVDARRAAEQATKTAREVSSKTTNMFEVAQDIVSKADKKGVPSSISKTMLAVADALGIKVTDKTTPEEFIKEIRKALVKWKSRGTESSQGKGDITRFVESQTNMPVKKMPKPIEEGPVNLLARPGSKPATLTKIKPVTETGAKEGPASVAELKGTKGFISQQPEQRALPGLELEPGIPKPKVEVPRIVKGASVSPVGAPGVHPALIPGATFATTTTKALADEQPAGEIAPPAGSFTEEQPEVELTPGIVTVTPSETAEVVPEHEIEPQTQAEPLTEAVTTTKVSYKTGTWAKTATRAKTGTREKAGTAAETGLKAKAGTSSKTRAASRIKALAATRASAQVRAAAKAATRQKTATRTQTKTQARARVRTRVQTRVIAKAKIITTKIPPPKIPPPIILKLAVKIHEGKSKEERAGAVAWKQGFMYKIIYPPYEEKDVISTTSPIPGVRYHTGPGSAARSAVIKHGAVPPVILYDMGIVQVNIQSQRSPSPYLTFERRKQTGPTLGKTRK